MKVIEPSFEVISAPLYEDVCRVLEICIRNAYKSEDKIGPGTGEKLIRNVLGRKPTPHESCIEHGGFTLRFITDRGVSHELVRHRLLSPTQESTRYCNYAKEKFGNEITFVTPAWYKEEAKYNKRGWWVKACKDSEASYFGMLGDGFTPQEARAALNNSTKTDVIATTNFREWRHIFNLRTHLTAHPDMRMLMRPALKWARETYPALFEGVGYMTDGEEHE